MTTTKLPRSSAVLAWHFLPDDGLTRYDHNGRGRIQVHAGRKLVHRSEVVLCRAGLHASERALDALQYAPGGIICRVACWGDVVRGDDKLAASKRAIIWMADATRVLHAFACDVAQDVLDAERSRGREPDARSYAAIAVRRLWLDGKASDAELDAAWAAAWAAARSAAWDAAWAAAWAAASAAASAAANARLTRMLEALAPAVAT